MPPRCANTLQAPLIEETSDSAFAHLEDLGSFPDRAVAVIHEKELQLNHHGCQAVGGLEGREVLSHKEVNPPQPGDRHEFSHSSSPFRC